MSDHNGWTESDFGSDEWKAGCSCGFESPPLTSEEAATAALAAHYAASEGAAA